MKLRQGKEGGGVAIITHNKVKSVHLKEYDVDGLEAVWADVMIDKKRMVVGSVYIAPGDIHSLALFDSVVDKILHCHSHILIAMDANSRSSLWDDTCIGIPHSRRSLQMGVLLEDIIIKYSLQIHNDGTATYRSGDISTAPDVTLSKGISDYGSVTWCVSDDDLRSPHECILVTIGNRAPCGKMEVIDWPHFDWAEYKQQTEVCLQKVYDKWMEQKEVLDLDSMVNELCVGIQECVDNTATTRTITKHSRPWISQEISDKFKELRKLKRKCRHRKSPVNVTEFSRVQEEVVNLVKQAEYDYWLAECNKLAGLGEREKWKAINRLTNQLSHQRVQPIRTVRDGKTVYIFDDEEIVKELENQHIRINSNTGVSHHLSDEDVLRHVKDMEDIARAGGGNEVMNALFSDDEIAQTFNKGSDTPGPDGISAKLIDNADREQMQKCLTVIFNESWVGGSFIKVWKQEDRAVLRKPGKEEYHECTAYRTVSVTSCLGKRLEYITSRRLVVVLENAKFDSFQFAYLNNRSTTQALLVLAESIKSGLIAGSKAGAVFFDFADAFGSVDRNRLLLKVSRDFGVSGRLFMHINSFLSDRFARIKANGVCGDWIESTMGTSAGTRMGPLLFICYVHDVPRAIHPKFADDLVAVSTGNSCAEIAVSLQKAVDDLVAWTEEWGMTLNVSKTKVMMFGAGKGDTIDLKMDQEAIEQVTRFKYLGVVLDEELDFTLQVDYVVGKAKRAMAKVSGLFDGRKGISVQLGIGLYKALVRPHLEYAVPVWAALDGKDLVRLEQLQVQCLRSITGVKAHSSTAAVEVVCGVMPLRARFRELCSREFLRIRMKEDGHMLKSLLDNSSRSGLRFCPLAYIHTMSKQLERRLEGCQFEKETWVLSHESSCDRVISRVHIVSPCRDKSQQEMEKDLEVVELFIQKHKGKSVMVFTDGSVYSGQVGCGACAAVLIPLSNEDDEHMASGAVGRSVDSTTCEIEGIVLGLEMSAQYYKERIQKGKQEVVYILSDCTAAIDMVIHRSWSLKSADLYNRLKRVQNSLSDLNISACIIWIPGHYGIAFNECADRLAKQLAYDIFKDRVSAPSIVSFASAVKVAAEIAMKSWQRKWELEVTGSYTRQLIPEVGTKILFPDNRDVGVSYCRMLLHDTMLNEDAYRTGTCESPICDCGMERESVEHFLWRCSKYQSARNTMLDTINDIRISSKNRSRFDISENVLLAPTWDSRVSRKDDRIIKAALFDFICTSDRKP